MKAKARGYLPNYGLGTGLSSGRAFLVADHMPVRIVSVTIRFRTAASAGCSNFLSMLSKGMRKAHSGGLHACGAGGSVLEQGTYTAHFLPAVLCEAARHARLRLAFLSFARVDDTHNLHNVDRYAIGLRDIRASRSRLRRCEFRRVLGLISGALTLLLALDALVDLFAVHGNAFGRVDTDPHLITLDPQNSDRHFVSDHHGLTDPSS